MPVSRFQWTDGAAKSFITDLHVQRQIPNAAYSTYFSRSLDKAALEVVTVGSGVFEITMTIEAERDFTKIRNLRAAALRGIEFTYTPDNDNPGTTYTVKAVMVGRVGLDRRGRQDMFTLTLTLARLDGGAFPVDV